MSKQQTKVGDITTVTEGIIIHQVNAQGVMGSGVAKALRDRHPSIFSDYIEVVKPNSPGHVSAAHLGKVIMSKVGPQLHVANLVGQQFYGSDGLKYTSYDAIDAGLIRLADWIDTHVGKGLMTEPAIHFPLLGSDRGGGKWEVVQAIIDHRLGKYVDRTLWLFM
jgi:O-acetyl-ADP-ribose deacetylase (regulator of RNase III)